MSGPVVARSAPTRERGYANTSSDITTASASQVDATGLTYTFVATGPGPVYVTAKLQVRNSVAGSVLVSLLQGATTIDSNFCSLNAVNSEETSVLFARPTNLVAGTSYTFKIQFSEFSGGGTAKIVGGADTSSLRIEAP